MGRSTDLIEALEPRQLLSFVVWDGGGGDHSWANPLNWSGDVLPGPADHVLIDAPGQEAVRFDADIVAAVASLWTLDPIEISAGTLRVAGQWRQSAALTMSGGRIEGGNLALNGAMTWSGGTIAGGASKLQVFAASALTISGNVALARQLVNAGSVTWESGDFDLSGGSIVNLPDRTFLIRSGGTMSGAASPFINYGTVARDGTPESTTTVGVIFSNYQGFILFPPFYEPLRGIVDVRSGTLAFTGTVLQKQIVHQESTLTGGDWRVQGAGRLLLPGEDIEYVSGKITLNGAGAAFPQIEDAEYFYDLTLAGGRPFTFTHVATPFLFRSGIDNLTIDSPGVTTTISTLVSISRLVLRAGTVEAVAGLSSYGYPESIELRAGSVLTLGGESSIRNVSGQGLLRITGHTVWSNGTMDTGNVRVEAGGRLTVGGGYSPYYIPNITTLRRRLVNYGTVDWEFVESFFYPFAANPEFTGQMVNWGVMNFRCIGLAMPYGGPSMPGVIVNHGVIDVAPQFGSLTLRGAGGGVMLNNLGTVNVHGQLILNGGTMGGGAWNVDAGAELVFGGLAGTLTDASMGGAGRVRVASTTAWTRVTAAGAEDFVVTPYGRLTLNQTANIQRAVVTNNGVVTWGPGASVAFGGSVTSNGVLDVGTGTATIARDLLLGAASTVKIRSASATEFGRLSLGDAAQLAGNLVVDFSWAPTVGVTFDFLSFRFRSGTFASAVSDTLPAGRTVRFSISGLNGRVTVVPG